MEMPRTENIDGEMAVNDEPTDVIHTNRCLHLTLRIIFSTPGLCVLVIFYSLMGAVIFPFFEAPLELHNTLAVIKSREECLRELWTITERLNVLYEQNWTMLVHEQLRRFEGSIIKATKGGLTEAMGERLPRWSFTEALLYSLTLITTIGYGSLTPRTVKGKLITMAYAMIGVPLMLMCLSNLGRVLAESVRQTYARLFIRQQLPHRYATEVDDNDDDNDDDDDDDVEHVAYNGTQQYQPVPQKNEECNLCQYNVFKETRTCNSNERSADAYHLLTNSPTKSILTNSQHSTPRRIVCLDHPLNQQQQQQQSINPTNNLQTYQTLGNCNTIDSPTHHQLIQIQSTNIDNGIVTLQPLINPNQFYYPVINRFQYHYPIAATMTITATTAATTATTATTTTTTIPQQPQPFFVQNDNNCDYYLTASGQQIYVPQSKLCRPSGSPQHQQYQPQQQQQQQQQTPQAQAQISIQPQYHIIHLPAQPNQANLLNKNQCNSNQQAIQFKQIHTATVHGLGRRKFLPKPLPQEINMLLSECDSNRYSDSTEKSITTQRPLTTHVTSSMDIHTSIASEQSSFKNQSQSTNVNSCNEHYNGHHGNMDTFDNDDNEHDDDDDDDDDDGNRIGSIHGTPSRIPLIAINQRASKNYDKNSDKTIERDNNHIQYNINHCNNKSQSHFHENNYQNNGKIRSMAIKSSTTTNPTTANNNIGIKNNANVPNDGETQVPIIVIVFILISYICIGTAIFSVWENWSFIDGAYFCFVTLSTIGFADMVPRKTFYGPDLQLFACCAYLFVGLILVTMSFSLLESQLIWKCKRMAARLKLRKD